MQEPFVRLGEIAIEDIAIDPVCRDAIPALLRGIQHMYCDEALRRQVFDLPDAHFLPGVDRGLGRPGMDLWRIFVLATLKQGIRCDDDRLQDLANCTGRFGRCSAIRGLTTIAGTSTGRWCVMSRC